jgi:hypothetical protein
MPKRKRSIYGFSDYEPTNNRRPIPSIEDDDEYDDYNHRENFEVERRPRRTSSTNNSRVYKSNNENNETNFLINIVGFLFFVPILLGFLLKLFGMMP